MTAKIKFGTSGWRAIIAEDFTFPNVRLATEAIGGYVKKSNKSPTLLIGYDTRFLSEEFGREVARVLSSQGIRAKLCDKAVPTPGVAYTIRAQKLDGAHQHHGQPQSGRIQRPQFSTPDGAPTTRSDGRDRTQHRRTSIAELTFTAKPNDALIESIDIGPAYLASSPPRPIQKIRDAVLPLAYDALHDPAPASLTASCLKTASRP
jgi:phosphoglucomutase